VKQGHAQPEPESHPGGSRRIWQELPGKALLRDTPAERKKAEEGKNEYFPRMSRIRFEN
jgi:hypothetical protein